MLSVKGDQKYRDYVTSPSRRAKELGCKSLTQVSEVTGQSLQTLGNWHRCKKDLFDIVCIGVSQYEKLTRRKADG